MVLRDELVRYLGDLLLAPCGCEDSSNNGLQVEGKPEVRVVCFGVDACQQLFDAATARGADFIFVHHGLSWRDNLRYLTGITGRRVGTLFQHGVSLYAAHLPLDQHPEVGNNAVIAQRLGLVNAVAGFEYGGEPIGYVGDLPEAMSAAELTARVNGILNTDSQVTACGPDTIHRVGVVSGGGADALAGCRAAGVDCLITGEMGHTHYHTALEWGVSVIAAGHYRTECPGVEAVMQRLARQFDLDTIFIDLPTGH